MGFLDAIVVLGGETHLQRTIDGAARHVVEADGRWLVRNDVEHPLFAIGGDHAAFGHIHRKGARRNRLIRRAFFCLCRHIATCAVGACRFGGKLLQGAGGLRLEGHFLAAIATGHTDRQFGGLWHGHRVVACRIAPCQKNRGAAGIGGRRDPGVETDIGIERTGCRSATEGICNRACTIGIGKTEGDNQKKGGNGA
ncbi:hypothetical protein D3C71_1658580 [compost metagenome]